MSSSRRPLLRVAVAVGGAVTVMRRVVVSAEAVCVAVIVAVPAATAVTSPAAFTVATLAADVENVTPVARAAVVALLYVPFTVSCWVPATTRLTVAGAMAIEASVGAAGATVITDVAVLPEAVAVMVAVPAATAVTRPVALAVAMAFDDELKVTPDVSAADDASL